MKSIEMNVEGFHVDSLAFGSKQSYTLWFDAGEGEIGRLPLHSIRGSKVGPTLLIMAAVHGDEYEGVQTVIELIRELQPDDMCGTLLLIPVTNLLSYAGISRLTPKDGCNLAREFPGDPRGTITQRLAWHIHHRLISKVDFLLDLHSGGTNYSVAEFVGYYYNPASELGKRSQAAAEVFGMDTIWGHPEPVSSGRTISSAHQLNIPWLYTEAYGGRRIKSTEQKSFLQGSLRLMNFLGMLVDSSRWIRTVPMVQRRLIGEGDFDIVEAEAVDGFFIPNVKLLDEVRAGEVIGVIYNWFGEQLKIIHAGADGLVMSLLGSPLAIKGESVFMLSLTEAQWNEKCNI